MSVLIGVLFYLTRRCEAADSNALQRSAAVGAFNSTNSKQVWGNWEKVDEPLPASEHRCSIPLGTI